MTLLGYHTLMTDTKLKTLQHIVHNASQYTMNSKKRRKEFAKEIATALNCWEEHALTFVEEMAGLNFMNIDDRLLFIQFAERGL